MRRRSLIYLLLTLVFLSLFSSKALAFDNNPSFQWWNSTYKYRIAVNISTGDYNRTNPPIEIELNFTSLLDSGNFDNNSARVIEYNSSGYVKREVPSQFDQYTAFDKTTNAIGEVVWIMNGTSDSISTRHYYIYFSREEDGSKESPSYASELTYSWGGEDLEVNNSEMIWKIDTNRSSMTSGFYYAEIKGGTTIFSVASNQKTAEYSGYNNGTDDTGFDLYGNMTLVHQGPVRLTFEQVGNETVFGTNEQTNEAQIKKKYVFYENNSWVKIDQNITNSSGASISRSSNYPYPLTIDTGRILTGGAGYTQPTAWSTDPFSSAFAYSISGNGGLGVINYMENNTENYRSSIDIANDALIIKLTSSTTISSWIRQLALLFFSESDSSTSFENFRNRTMAPIQKTLGSAEIHTLLLSLTADQTIYNRNETIILRVNVTQDPFNSVDSINATLNNATSGTSDDATIQLYDDGNHNDLNPGDNVYGNNYTFLPSSNIGIWNFTAKPYDAYSQELNQTIMAFNVTDEYNVNTSISNPLGVGGRQVLATITVKNYRNDTLISGAAIDCSFNGTTVINKTDNGDGTYSINFTAPTGLGKYLLECNASKAENIGTGYGDFYSQLPQTTFTADITPDSLSFDNITQDYSPSLIFIVNATNTGQGTGYSPEITIYKPSPWSSNSTTVSCGDMLPGSECIAYFEINVTKGASPLNYTINSTIGWTNLDSSDANTTDTSYINISSNPILNVTPENISDTVYEGANKTFYLALNSTGNDNTLDINLSSSGFPSEWNITFTPSNISFLSSGSWENVSAEIAIPEGYTNGTFEGLFSINNTNTQNTSINVNITVPATQTWTINQTLCQDIVMKNANETLCDILIENTGNQILNFTLTPSGWENFTSLNEVEFTLNPTTQHNFSILYDTDDTQGIFRRNYTVSSDNGTQTIQTIITVTYGPLVEIISISPNVTEQGETILINASVLDRTQSGISSVQINVTTPDGIINTASMQFLRNESWTEYYSIYYPLTWGSTLKSGFYNFTVTAIDVLNAVNSQISNFTIYKNLVVNMSTLSPQYYKCGSGRVFYSIKDLENTSLSNVSVSFEIKDPNGRLIWNNQNLTLTADENGTIEPLPSFSITCDDSDGTYALYSTSAYFDNTTNITVNKTTSYNFNVLTPIEATIYSDSPVYPNSSIDFLITVLDNNKQPIDPDNMDLTIYNPSKTIEHSINKSQMTKLSNATGIYYYSYNVSSDAQKGTYLIVLNVTKSTSSTIATTVFSVSESNTRVEIDTVPLWYASNTARFFVTIYDDDNQLVNADSINLTVYDPDLNPLSVLFTINQFSTGIYYAQWTIPSSPTTGQYMIRVNISVNGSEAQDITTFRILQGGPFQFEIDAPTVGYIGQTMTFTVNATNEGDGPAESQFSCWIDAGGTNQSQISWSKLISAGENYAVEKDILIPSGLSEGSYILNCQLHVVNGSIGDVYAQDTFLAESPAAPTPQIEAAGAPTGAAAAPGILVVSKPSLEITKLYPSMIQMERGSEQYLVIFVENNGNTELNDISVYIDGLDSGWADVVQKIPDLQPGSSSIIIVKISLPLSIEAKDYHLFLKVFSDNITGSKSITLRVYQSKIELLTAQIEQLKQDLLDLQIQTLELKLKDEDVSNIVSLIEKINKQIFEAEYLLDKNNYVETSEKINSARNDFNNAIYELSTLMREKKIFLELDVKMILAIFLGIILIVAISIFIVIWLSKRKGVKETRKVEKKPKAEMESMIDELKKSVEDLKKVAYDKHEKGEVKNRRELFKRLENEKSNIENILKTLDEQYREKILSPKPYNELKERNKKMLEIIDKKMSNLGLIETKTQTSQQNKNLMSAIDKQYRDGLISYELKEKLIKRMDEDI